MIFKIVNYFVLLILYFYAKCIEVAVAPLDRDTLRGLVLILKLTIEIILLRLRNQLEN
jgi:hypothetical protein